MDNTIIDDTFRTIVEKMPDLYADLVKLVSKIAAYIFREEDKVEKGQMRSWAEKSCCWDRRGSGITGEAAHAV